MESALKDMERIPGDRQGQQGSSVVKALAMDQLKFNHRTHTVEVKKKKN